MAQRLEFDDPDARYFQTGVDRGVLYLPNKAVVWNGITGFEESGNGTSSIAYIDGKIYLADMDATDFSGKLTAFFWPDEFSECLGMPQVAEGLYVDNQKPKRFGFSYRTLVGSGSTGDMFGHQIHLVYNAIASIGTKQRKTINDTPDPLDFQFELVCTPVQLPGYRPTAHYIIDTRNMTPETVSSLEDILYGSAEADARLPEPEELFDLLNFGDAITVTVHQNGEITFTGSNKKVYMIGPDTYQIDGINAVINSDGTIDISDGGDTDVIIL